MRINATCRKLLAVLLSFTLIISNCLCAFADDKTTPVVIINGVETSASPEEEVSVIDGNITVDGSYYDPALRVINDQNAAENVIITVEGEVSKTGEYNHEPAVEVRNDSDTELSLTIENGISSVSTESYSDVVALSVDSSNEDAKTVGCGKR